MILTKDLYKLVHFGKLTPPHNGRIPKMQMTVFSRIFMVSASGRENLGNVGFTLAPLPYTHFDQNQELGHFGKLTPPQRGEIPEMPIAVCFGAENPLFFQGKFFDFSSICWPKMGPPISDRAHIFKNLSGQKIVQFSISTLPLSGRIPEMPKNCVLGHESAPCHPKTSGKKKKKKKMSDPPQFGGGGVGGPPPPPRLQNIMRKLSAKMIYIPSRGDPVNFSECIFL